MNELNELNGQCVPGPSPIELIQLIRTALQEHVSRMGPTRVTEGVT
jgi:hypothetical protein